jgi:hypothetical protein
MFSAYCFFLAFCSLSSSAPDSSSGTIGGKSFSVINCEAPFLMSGVTYAYDHLLKMFAVRIGFSPGSGFSGPMHSSENAIRPNKVAHLKYRFRQKLGNCGMPFACVHRSVSRTYTGQKRSETEDGRRVRWWLRYVSTVKETSATGSRTADNHVI